MITNHSEYQALYRKYRPQTFSDVYGQDHIINALANAVSQNKTSHAYLFSGHRGTGKTTIAKVFAKNINCLNPSDGIACEKCSSCVEINKGLSGDIFEIDAASNNGVDEIRELINNATYLPISLPKKVYIIDEVHMLSKGAFNAFLKTLEEPPPHVVFVLATTEPEKIPITIMSRCQRFDFLRISKSKITARLQEILTIEQITIDDKSLNYIVRAADGSLRDALNVLDKVNTASSGEITYEKTIQALGILSMELKHEIVTNLIAQNRPKLLELAIQINEKGISIPNLAVDLLYLFRDLLILKTTHTDEHCTYYELWMDEIILKVTEQQLIEVIFEISQMLNNSKNLNNATLLFEILLLKLSNILNTTIETIPAPFSQKKVELPANKPNIVENEESKISKDPVNNDHLQNLEEPIKTSQEKIDKVTMAASIIQEGSVDQVLSQATIKAKTTATKVIFEIVNETNTNNQFALATFFENCKCVAASPSSIILTTSSDIITQFDKRMAEIKNLIMTKNQNLNNVTILSDEDWKTKRASYLQKVKNGNNFSEFEKTMQKQFENKFITTQ